VIKINFFELKNGLKIYYLFNPNSLISFLQVWYHFGSAQEEAEKNGIAHLIEHIFFKGTEEIEETEYSRLIQREGGSCNAFTSEEKICFYETIPTEKLEMIIKMEADRMKNLKITEEKFEKEKKVVMEEFKERIQNQPIVKPLIEVRKDVFGDHPFSRDPAGNIETINNIKFEDVINYYENYFHPKNCTLIIVSSKDFEEAKEIIEKHFGNIEKKGKIPLPIPPLSKPAKEYVEKKIPIKATVFSKTYFLPKKEEFFFPLNLLHNLIGGDEDSILKREIQEEKFYVLQAGTFPFFSNSGTLFLFFSLHLPFIKKYNFLKKIDDLYKNKIKEILNDKKFEELKGRMAISLLSSLNGSEKIGLYLADCIISRGSPDHFFNDLKNIENLKIEEVFKTLEFLKEAPSCEVLLKGSLWKKI